VTTAGAVAALVLHASVCTPAAGYVPVIDTGRRGVPGGRASAIDAQSFSRIVAAGVAKTAFQGRLRRGVPGFAASTCHTIAQAAGPPARCGAWLRGGREREEAPGTPYALAGLQ